MMSSHALSFFAFVAGFRTCLAVAATCETDQVSCEGNADAALQPSSLLQRQHAQGTSSLRSAVEETGHGCGEQRIIPMLDSERTLNALILQPESKHLGFIHIPHNGGGNIETLGLKNGIKWGFHAVNHTYVQKLQLTSSHVCTWHLVPPRFLPGVKVYTDKPLFCVTRDPADRLFSTYLSVIKTLDHNCPISKADFQILSPYERCTPESLNYFATAALKGSQYAFDCNMIPQSTYLSYWDGKQICNEVIKFKDVPTALPALMTKYNIPMSESVKLPSLLQTFEQSARKQGSETERSSCPGLTSADFDANSKLAILDYYHDDFLNLGYN